MHRNRASSVLIVALSLSTAHVARAQCETLLSAFDGDTGNGFGHVAAMEGALAAIGAPHDDVVGAYSGSAYVVDVTTGQALYKLQAATGQPGELFGYALAAGEGLLAVGAPGIGTQWGPARVYDLATGALWSELVPSGPADEFGAALAIGNGHVVVGDPHLGTATLFDALTGVERFSWSDPTGTGATFYGRAVAIGAFRVYVGAGAEQNAYGDLGVVHVYDAATGAPLGDLARPSNAAFFGWSLAVSGSTLVVGSAERMNLYDVATGAHLAELDVPASQLVSVDGDVAVVSDGWAPVSYVVSLTDGKVLHTLEGDLPVTSVAASAERWIVCNTMGGYGELAHVWDATDADGDLFPDCEDLGVSYCGPAEVNSTGANAWIAAGGSPRVADEDLSLRALALPLNQTGYFLASRTQDFVPFAGGSQGNLCLAGQIGRFSSQVKNSGAKGRFAIHVDLTSMPPVGQAVLPGEDWNFQAWYRDLNPNPTSNFTDAVNVLFR